MGLCCSDRRRPVDGFERVNALACPLAFEDPAHPIGSGIPRFYKLVRRRDNVSESSDSEWLGRGDHHAPELAFYDDAARLRGKPKWRVLDFLVEYRGVLRGMPCLAPASGGMGSRLVSSDLMVFRSPFEGLACARLLSLNVGARSLALTCRGTAPLDTAMYASDGVRVEGFLCPPASVRSEDPTETRAWAWGNMVQPRAQYLPLCRTSLIEVLTNFIDLRDAIRQEKLWGVEDAGAFALEFLTSSEYSECALLSVVKNVSSLLAACVESISQKWAGSSLGLMVDVGAAPPRAFGESWVQARVRTRVSGWSWSTVCTSADEDTVASWNVYKASLSRVLWDASRLYLHKFCTREWQMLKVKVYAFTPKQDTLLGLAETRLQTDTCGQQVLPLTRCDSSQCTGIAPAEVTVGVSWTAFPSPSRLAGAWRISIKSASGLSKTSVCEIFAVVTVSSEDPQGTRRSVQRTKVVPSEEAEKVGWMEDHLEFPVAGVVSVERLVQALGVKCQDGVSATVIKHLPSAAEESAQASQSDAMHQLGFMEVLRRRPRATEEDSMEAARETAPEEEMGALW
mmetsp:Transcript_29689/g.78764  ORF Transcript_29689/g.78764 Transcript_29689/m.78764 type:complete len:568 (-) Transcript_29689:38-1741(-)